MKNTIVFLGILMFGFSVIEAAEIDLPERVDNAAIHYWAAVALLPRAQTQEEIDAIEFIEGDSQKLPPAALEREELVIELLRKNKDSMRELHEGSLKADCNFDLAYEKGPDMLLNHLVHMRIITRHALAVAKLHEMEGQPEQAVEIHGDVLRMAAHLDEDKLLISGLVGTAIVSMALNDVEGFLSRQPDEEAIELLLGRVSRIPAKPFNVAEYIRAEALIWGDWGIRTLPTELDGSPGPGAEHFVPSQPWKIEPEKREEAVRKWVEEYRRVMSEFAANLEKPYQEARVAIREQEKTWESPEAKMKNPLISLVLPAVSRAADSLTLPEAKLGMCRILCAASLVKARSGKYPKAIDELAEFFPDGFPVDPFTGKGYTYRLEDGMPYIRCNPPEELWEKRSGIYEFGLSRRLREDEEALKKFTSEKE